MQKVKHILLLVTAVLLVAGCSPARKFKDIRLTSWEIRDVRPQGFRGLNATIAVGIDNPATSVTITRQSRSASTIRPRASPSTGWKA